LGEEELPKTLSPPLLLAKVRLAPEYLGCGVIKLAWVETLDALDTLEDFLDDAPAETAGEGLEDALVDAAEIDDVLDSALGDCSAAEVEPLEVLDANDVKAFGREVPLDRVEALDAELE